MLLDGKTAVVTGSSKGIGRGYAMALAKEGASVVVNGTAADDVAQVVEQIKSAGGNAIGCTESVATMVGAERIIQSALDEFGHLDILVNNAGNLRDRTFLKMTEEEWDAVIAVHLKGTFACSKFAALAMMQQQSGCIMNTVSRAGFWGSFGQSNYAAAKAGIMGFTLTLAVELARYNIAANCIWPRARTRMTKHAEQWLPKNDGEPRPIRSAVDASLAEPETVAPLVVFLASDEARNITGKIIGLTGDIMTVWSPPREVASLTMVRGWTVDEIRNRLKLTLDTAL